jgi:hypothetical protein
MVSPLGALLQRGVVVVPQLEQTVADTWLGFFVCFSGIGGGGVITIFFIVYI